MQQHSEAAPVVPLAEAVRWFRRWVSPEGVEARQPSTRATVYNAWVVLWLMVYQRLQGNAPLSGAVAEVQRMDPGLLPDNKRTQEGTLSGNTGAYARARQRLKEEVAEHAADEVACSLITQSAPSWGSQRAFLLDGSTLSLASQEQLRQAYPPGQNQHGASAWPLLRLVTAHELSSGAALRPEVGPAAGPEAVSEVALSAGLLPRLPAGSVLIGDRNFGVFAFAWMAHTAGHDFLLRLTEKRFRAFVRGATPQGAGRWKLAWRPSRFDRRRHPELPLDAVLHVELHAVPVSPQLTLWLVSDLAAAGNELAQLYQGRQHIETDLRHLKQTLLLEEARAHSAAMVRKELAAASIAYNLVIMIRRLAAERIQVEPRQLSFSRIWQFVRALLLEPLDPAETQRRLDLVLRLAGQCKLPRRPGRHYPRQVIPRRRKFPERASRPPPAS